MDAERLLDGDTPQERRLDRVLEALVVLAALATIPIAIEQERGVTSALLEVGDWIVWGIFLTEYVTMFALANDKRHYLLNNKLNVAIIALTVPAWPALFGLIRLARVARLARIIRLPVVFMRGLYGLQVAIGRPGFIYVLSVTCLLTLGGGALMAAVEPEIVKGNVWAGIWWAIITVTTIGYGDVVPASTAGKVLGILLKLAGVGLVSTLTASIAAYFVEHEKQAETRRVTDQLSRIEVLLERHAASEGLASEGVRTDGVRTDGVRTVQTAIGPVRHSDSAH